VGDYMPIEIDGTIYYRTSEACKKTGVSRATLFRWLKAGILDKHHKDRRGWNLFTEEDVAKIRAEAKIVNIEEVYQPINIARKKSQVSQNQF
jgi:predicted site-specific integrase-resolvase